MNKNLNYVSEAMELIHLILSTEDFSWLREGPKIVLDFSDQKYEYLQPGSFLRQVKKMEYRHWTECVDQAKKDYMQLKLAIPKFI